MTDKAKLRAIHRLCLTHLGDKNSLTKEIRRIIMSGNNKFKVDE